MHSGSPLHWARMVGLLVLLTASAARLAADIAIENLRCDWATNPVGVDSAVPRLSWELASVVRGERQTAWQVQVASSSDLLVRGRPDQWDSGRIGDDRQLQVPYGGKPLPTGQQVFWRVRVWNHRGNASPWSGIGTWTMGIVSKRDWVAHWITDPELLALTRAKLGFSTPPVSDPATPQWLTVDLGRSYPLESVVLDALVHTVTERLGFPRWFKIEVAETPGFADAKLLVDHTTDGINEWLTRVTVPAGNSPARYVRLTATRLRMTAEDDAKAPVGRLALRQIEVYAGGRNVAVGAHVTASSSLEEGPWGAAAVVDGKEIPGDDPRLAGTLLLRGEFKVRGAVRRALLFSTGLGTYTIAVNGSACGAEDFGKPGWTDPERTCFYDTYDVTRALRPGSNAIGLTLAGGMYNVPAIPGRYTKFVSAFRPLVGLVQVRIEYADGRTDTVATGRDWRVAPGPTTFAQVYGGEDYDARREPPAWTEPGFDAAGWRPAVEVSGPGGELRGTSLAAPPIRHEGTLPVLRRQELQPGVTVYDLGQNAAVLPRIRVHGPAGSTIKLSPAELLKPDGHIDPSSTRPSNSDASWNYTLRGGASETWTPQFFYHGARYLEVRCSAPGDGVLPVVDQIEAVVVHSDSPAAGTFACSNDLLNRIAALVRWAQRSNMVSVLTDCPHRERLGWLEQYHLNGPALRYNYDLTRLYAKTLEDMADAQHPSGLIPDIAPEYVRFSEGFVDSPEWGSAAILAAWQQFVWTGDEATLQRAYPTMRRYFDYLASRAEDHLLTFGLGDWYDLGPARPGVAQLTPIAVTASAIYYEDTRALERIATQLGLRDDAARYREAATAIAAAFNRRFLDTTKHSYATGSQTANAMPLVVGLAPPEQRAGIVEHLVADIRNHGEALTSGDVGYRYLLRALADSGRSDVVFAMNNQTERPGYGLQLARGATSLTEAWDANRHSSQNHFMLGQINEWLYRDLVGLAPDPAAPAFGHVLIHPNPVGDVTFAHATYHSVRGPIDVGWKRSSAGFQLNVSLPPNARATIIFPVDPATHLQEHGQPIEQVNDLRRLPAVDGHPAIEVGSGRYEFTCR